MKCNDLSVSLNLGSIYDFYFLKQGGGHWYTWTEYITKEEEHIPANAKVRQIFAMELWFLKLPKISPRWRN